MVVALVQQATTLNGTTVTINNIPSNFHNETVASGIRFIVTSTGSSQTYNYHKATLAESDLVGLSGDINDFNERYRVGSSNPTSNNDAGDLFYNTKLQINYSYIIAQLVRLKKHSQLDNTL